MTNSDKKLLNIPQTSNDKTLSKGQKQFNNLIKKIDKEKKALLDWQETIPKINEKVANELLTKTDTYSGLRKDFVYLFDSVFGNKLFTKTDKAKMSSIIVDVTTDLIDQYGMHELKELHDKYSDRGYDELEQEETYFKGEMVKTVMSDILGMDVGDVDLDSPDDINAFISEKLGELKEQEKMERIKAEERRSKRKKTPKQLEKEQKQQQAEQEISQSVREVYRKLTSELHPDRERDPLERERKTELMQRVNAAYAKKDLLKLLELQLEIEQIDQDHLNNISDERLQFFNKILKEQLLELQQEIAIIQQPFKMQLNMFPTERLTTKQLFRQLDHDIGQMQEDIFILTNDLEKFTDQKQIKAWLKGYKIQKQRDFYEDFFDMPSFPF